MLDDIRPPSPDSIEFFLNGPSAIYLFLESSSSSPGHESRNDAEVMSQEAKWDNSEDSILLVKEDLRGRQIESKEDKFKELGANPQRK